MVVYSPYAEKDFPTLRNFAKEHFSEKTFSHFHYIDRYLFNTGRL